LSSQPYNVVKNISYVPNIQLKGIKHEDFLPHNQNLYEQSIIIIKDMKRELLIIITLSLIISGCVDQDPTPADSTQQGQIETELIDLSDITGENTEFIKYYSLQPLNINVQVPQYQLPLPADQISNYDAFSESIPLSSEALDLLEKNGFVVIKNRLWTCWKRTDLL